MSTFRQSLRDAVRRLAYKTSVDQLKKRGVQKVNVIGLDRIVALIDEAVHRTLRHRLLATERYQVADATKEEFLRLLKSNEELKAAHSRAEEEANALRLEHQRLQQQLEERLEEARAQRSVDYAREDARIVATIRTVVETLPLGGAEALSMQERLEELVMSVVEQERAAASAERGAARDSEIAVLQRRIDKLNRSLADAEQELGQVARRKGIDPGIASIYREVQGLDTAEAKAEQKRALMADIFQANLKLQKKP